MVLEAQTRLYQSRIASHNSVVSHSLLFVDQTTEQNEKHKQHASASPVTSPACRKDCW